MSLDFRFAIISDPHVALPHTVWDSPRRLHLVEVSILALETIFEQLRHLQLDFLLLPGDLTQHGEADNHAWLSQRLAQLPYPAYVIPGNHDIPEAKARDAEEDKSTLRTIHPTQFPHYYRSFGYAQTDQLYYECHPIPGVRLIGLNSIAFDHNNKQIGRVDRAQMQWLEKVLNERSHVLTLVMIHHNIVEHIPGQARHPISRRYMLENACELRTLLAEAGIQLVFTGHLHIQDIASWNGVYDITTGSLVTYPHPYRVLHCYTDSQGQICLNIESERVKSVPGWENLQQTSRDLLGQFSPVFMRQLLTQPPLNLSLTEAEKLIPDLQNFWADIANGDAIFNFPHFPSTVRDFLEQFSAVAPDGSPRLIDNATTLLLSQHHSINSKDC